MKGIHLFSVNGTSIRRRCLSQGTPVVQISAIHLLAQQCPLSADDYLALLVCLDAKDETIRSAARLAIGKGCAPGIRETMGQISLLLLQRISDTAQPESDRVEYLIALDRVLEKAGLAENVSLTIREALLSLRAEAANDVSKWARHCLASLARSNS
jgi:hypothetical protein